MWKKLTIAAVLSLFLAGCGSKQTAVSTELPFKGYKGELEEYEKAQAAARPTPSLWSQSHGVLFSDYKARMVGDLVNVRIVESASANNSNNTGTSKSANYNATITSIMGLPTDLGIGDLLNTGNDFDPTVAASTNNTWSGQGSKTRSDTMSATIAARVIDVLPSGNLVIEGQREIMIDQEKQTMTVRGVIRPKDIDSDNTVLSSRIADAQIRYYGDGVISDANRKGWLATFIDWIWPF